MISCPFKYPGNSVYCGCPYPKGELNWIGISRSLEEIRMLHMIEIENEEKQDEVHSI